MANWMKKMVADMQRRESRMIKISSVREIAVLWQATGVGARNGVDFALSYNTDISGNAIANDLNNWVGENWIGAVITKATDSMLCLNIVAHNGSFTLCASYPITGQGNYTSILEAALTYYLGELTKAKNLASQPCIEMFCTCGD